VSQNPGHTSASFRQSPNQSYVNTGAAPAFQPTPPPTHQSFQNVEVTKNEARRAASVMNRYNNAYRKAKLICAIGMIVKIIGGLISLFFGIYGYLFGFILTSPRTLYSSHGESPWPIIIGIITAGIVFLFFYIIGTLIAAVGELIKAQLDSAVNSSPFLNDNERAQTMSL
jgi:hypothetical protein